VTVDPSALDPSALDPSALDPSNATASASSHAASVVGRHRRLLRLAGPRGIVAGIAIDHRDSLRVMLERRGVTGLTSEALRSMKLVLARALAPVATAIMLDEELGGLALEPGVIPASVGLIMPLEAQGYETAGAGPMTTLLADFSPAAALRYGADACKLLLPYRADDPESAAHQEALVAATAEACHELGVPLVLEPLVYRRPSDTDEAYADAYDRLVLHAVTRLEPLGVDLLKLPFPVLDLKAAGESVALAACRALHDACADTPWVLLGAGADGDTFLEQIRLAGTAGASGFLAGRGIWGAAVGPDVRATERIASTVCRADLERCRELAERVAQPIQPSGKG
jgi:tagatose-1,6-bisphosphate aldolase